MRKIGFLDIPETTAEVQRMFDEDTAELGYVMNVSRLWAYQPATVTGLITLLVQVNSGDRLSPASALDTRHRVHVGVRRFVLRIGMG
jgi:hypothetical protein